MNESKHKQLMAAARQVPAVSVPAGFHDDVLRAIHGGRGSADASPDSVLDHLAGLFPRLAAAALLVIMAAGSFEFFAGGDVASLLTAASDQWLLPLDWL